MVTPYASMVDGILSEEKDMKGRVIKLDDPDTLSTEVLRLIKTLDGKTEDEKVMHLKKILLYLKQDLSLK